ncbi:MAG: SPFH domain-containing protein, partial [Oscillospiraceae bacterium]|nr:SPFH domain-containing protein [Oscillospiraceae bacterium]
AVGFMGLNMAAQAGGIDAQSLYAMGAQQQAAKPAAQPAAPAVDNWTCPSCGKAAFGKFCPECGAKKPEDGWTCPSCGKVNKGKFCSECGAKKPAAALLYRCDKCGWEPEDPAHPPKFCPECGDPFDEADIQ